MSSSERLFLLDGMALAYRAYYSFIGRPLRNSRGQNTSAAYGFIATLIKILDDHQPDHIAAVFDTKEPTFRHHMYTDYKATRESMPEDMVPQIEWIKTAVRAFRTPVLELPGFEADDIMGTLARRAELQGVHTFLVTADKDMMQLVSPLVTMLRPGKGSADLEPVEASGVATKFGVTPDRVIDVLALIGDKSDNVPGVPGIGEKTAIPLVQTWGTIERLYDHLEEVPQKGVREKLTRNRELAFLSKKLVTIDTAVPIDVDFHTLRAQPPDLAALAPLFEELDFKGLLSRLRDRTEGGSVPLPVSSEAEPSAPVEPPEIPAATIETLPHTYHCVATENELSSLCNALAGAAAFAIDTETTSSDPMRAVLVGCSFSIEPGEAWYVPVAHEGPGEDEGQFALSSVGQTHNATPIGLPLSTVVSALRPILENAEKNLIGQNLKYDALVLRRHGITLPPPAFDTMVAGYILRPDGQHSLDSMALEFLHYRMVSFDDLTGTGKKRVPITDVPLERVAAYAAEDADMTLRLYRHQEPLLRTDGLLDLCRTIEFPLIAVLGDMEFQGVRIDAAQLATMGAAIEQNVQRLTGEIHTLAGDPFNINSTKQLGEVLFTKLGLPPVRKTKTGFSTDVAVLDTLQGQHPIIDHLLEYRQLTKLKSTYVDALPNLVHPETGRVHTSYNQTVAATGRLSSSDPNLQNIPIRTELGREIRRAFIAGEPGWELLSADYSQIELRVMAHISGDEALRSAFLNDEDIHVSTAAKVFGVSAADVTRDMRRKAKEVNFGIMYGIGPFGLSNRLDVSQPEAKEIIARYFDRFPKVKQYINDTLEQVRRSGYVQTMLGRRRYLPDIDSKNQNIRGNAERQAINMPIQGTSADMIKIAMVRLHHQMRMNSYRSRLLLQVHDELVCEVPGAEKEAMAALVKEVMQNALPLEVPVKVDVGFGASWLEAH